MLSHVQYVRELLDRSILDCLLWFDTRDMGADGMTKGSVDRKAIVSIMSGSNVQEHPFRVWRPAVSAPSLTCLGPGNVSKTSSVADTANVTETEPVEDAGVEDRRSNTMSSSSQINTAVVSAIVVASQVGSAEAFVFNIEADEVATLVWTILAGVVGLCLVWSWRWKANKQSPKGDEKSDRRSL